MERPIDHRQSKKQYKMFSELPMLALSLSRFAYEAVSARLIIRKMCKRLRGRDFLDEAKQRNKPFNKKKLMNICMYSK